MKNKIIDLFCGCGGLSKGFEDAGFETIAAIDKWNDAVYTYNKNHTQNIAQCVDIKDWDEKYLKKLNANNEVVGIIGGPPCQGYSTVGTRNIDDPRNQLYKEYCRVVETIKPDFFVLENVKGLLTLDNGSFKKDIHERFEKLGYKVSFDILNAADFGVPQNRQRVFFVGLKNGKKFIFPKPIETKVTTYEALSDLPALSNGVDESTEYNFDPQNEYQKFMRKKSNKLDNHVATKHTEETREIISKIKDGGSIKDLPKEYWEVRKYNKAFQRMASNGQSNTVDTGHRNYFHYKENRIPTVRENARLQSFTDDFKFYGSKTSQYKQVGNAVPPLLAFAIAKEIKKQI